MKFKQQTTLLSKSIRAGLLGLSLMSALHSGIASAQDEPPGRVGRIGYSYGQISFADAGSNQWTELLPNRPISIGDSVFVGDQSRAELQVGNSTIRINENTRLSFINLTDDTTQIQLSQGTVVLRVRALSEREVFEISTPNLNFSIQEPGEYRININHDNTSSVIVRRGIGVAQGDRDVITLREGEYTRFSGTNLNHTSITRAPNFDTFDQWAFDRDRAEETSISARYVPREMVGYQQLDEYGTWETHVEYGAIWYPRGISVGWAPYRDGRWVWVAPWGWTWVDRAPWGFAPYHYGRWAHIGHRWAWIPGRYERHHRPIYAPALVAFVGASRDGVSVGVSVGSKHSMSPSVSWYPLGPGESYRPHYTQSTRYIQNINQTVINNTVVINRNRDVYINRNVPHAVTSVPQNTFVRGEHVFPATKSILGNQIKQLQVLNEAPNLQPEKNNRFGDARPRTWQENDQYRSRATVAPNPAQDPRVTNDSRGRENWRGRNIEGTSAINAANSVGLQEPRSNTNSNSQIAPTQPNYVNQVERQSNGNVVQYPQRPSANSSAAQVNASPNYVTPTERTSNGAVVQYPQRPERGEGGMPTNSSGINSRNFDEMQAERNRASRYEDGARALPNNRIDPRRESNLNVGPATNTPPSASVQAQMQPQTTSPAAPQAMPRVMERPVERVVERNERIIERMERPERLIERGNERPIERPQATFAPRPEPARIESPRAEMPRAAEVRREQNMPMPTQAVPVPTPQPAATPTPRASTEKSKDKTEDGRAKKNER